jgi:hypothetical protein
MQPDNLAADIPLQAAIAAHAGTSFSPDQRGHSEQSGYAATLARVYADLAAHAAKGGTLDQLAGEFDQLRAGYRRRVLAYLASRARCVSWMIAGPSNFPVARMQKRNGVADRRGTDCADYLAAATRAAVRNLRPDLRPIMAGDADAVQRLQADIDKAEAVHARMRAANATIRQHAKAGADAQAAALVAQGFSDRQARELIAPDFCGRVGFPDYALTNNGANVRRMRARLAQLQAAKAAPLAMVYGADGITLQDDPPANRVRLLFPGKPAADVRDRLKAGGFRWAPSVGAWQAYRNPRAIALAQSIAGPADSAAA